MSVKDEESRLKEKMKNMMLKNIDELSSLVSSLQDEDQKKLMVEYAKVLKDPNERKKFEEDMKKMKEMKLEFKPLLQDDNNKKEESNKKDEEGVVYFIPEKGFCIETKILIYRNYKQEYISLYINICWSDNVNNAKAKLSNACRHHCHHQHNHEHKDDSIKDSTGIKNDDENRWDIPYIIHRQYKDYQMKIYDFVIGSKPYKRCLKDSKFKDLIIQTSFQVIEEKFSESIQKDNITIHKDMIYKEIPLISTVKSKKSSNHQDFVQNVINNLNRTPLLHFIKTNQKRTLTEHQSDILFNILIDHYYNSSDFNIGIPLIIFSIDESLFIESLKVYLPPFRIIQCKSFVRFIFCKYNIEKTSIRISIDDDDEKNNPSIECIFIDKENKEYSFFAYLYDKIDPSLSYSTFHEDSHSSIVIILKKLKDDIWDTPIKLKK